MITDERLQQALTYLAETDTTCAELKTDVERQHFKLKKIRASFFECASGNIEERKAIAETSEPVQDQVENYLDSLQLHNSMENKRKTEQLIVEVWRSMNANRRQGQI